MEYCSICAHKQLNSQYHKDSVEHRFNFAIFQYEKYRKRLLKDDARGVTIDVKPKLQKNLRLDFEYVQKRGKYTAKILTEQLVLHNRITFQCGIHNKGNDVIYIVSAILAHPSKLYQLVYDKNLNFRYGLDTKIALSPGACYSFEIIFSVKDITTSELLIPLICNFQTVNNEVFTIPRAISVVITDLEEENETKTKSPYTRQRWENVTIVNPTQRLHYATNYAIPAKYLKLLKFGLQQFSSITAGEEDILLDIQRDLKELRESNYNTYWHFVLWLEEVAQTIMLQKYNMENVTLSIKQNNILVLEVPGLAEKRPSVIAGDMIDIRLHDDHTAYRGIVKRIYDKTIDIFYVDHNLTNYIKQNPGTLLDVAFILNRLIFERMHEAVDKVASRMIPAVFPDDVHRPSKNILYNIQFYNTEIMDNPEQKNAVIQIINSTHHVAPYIVFGPPGTGKTITIVEAILQIKKNTNKRILVCAPANSACDNIAIMLLPHCTRSELIRIHSDTRETSTLTEALKKYSNMEEEGAFKKMSVGAVMQFRIVVTTLTLIGKYRDYKPDCVFVDEAAQACEPETDIAVGFLEAGQQLVLAGDPKQLGPMVSSKCANEYGLGISLLERLMEFGMYKPDVHSGCYNSNFITMLKLNFRSHPNILAIPNEFFYDNSLIANSVKAQNDPIASIAIFRQTEAHRMNNKVYPGNALEFCSVTAKERREGSSPSYFNPAEVKMVLQYVQKLMNLNLEGDDKVQLDHIGVITPYKRQVHKIKDALQRNGFEGIEVGTTEAYQGREKRIIIISTVRAQSSLLLHDRKYDLGFVKHEQRFNVAVTRAISKLIVIGCQIVLSTDSRWQKFIELCRQYKTYFGVPYVERNSEWKGEVANRLKHLKSRDRAHHTSSRRK